MIAGVEVGPDPEGFEALEETFSMFFRWLPQVRGRQRAGGAAANATPEQKLPVPVVVAHGLAGATTLVLVLVAAAKV